ncbi:MAG TPA: YIP1 family protein [Bryobacteraceae bacterium]|nr:YIP1 family protein [Bryobacteraceae bacterium]
MPEAQAVAMQAERPRMGEIRRVLTILFWEPGAGFADVARRPICWVPILLVVMCAMTYMYLVSQRIGWEQVVRTGAAASEQFQNMPAVDRERVIAQQSKFVGIFAYAAAAVGTPISSLVVAGVVMLLFTVFLGGQARFGQLFGVVSYAQLPHIISMAISSVVLHLKAPADFDMQNPLALNVGFYLPESLPKWVVGIGSSIDLFSFWIIALIVIGLRATDPKASRSTALISILAPWALYVFGKAAWSALMS